jgi:hypothetical protein
MSVAEVSKTTTKPHIKIGIGIPLYGGMGFCGFFVSLINTMNVLKQHGVESYPIFILGESLITRARNNIVAKFLNDPDSTHLMFIDGDITWDPVEVIKLLNHNKSLVGGIYPLKTYKWENLSNIEEYKARNKLDINKDVPETEFIRQNLLKYNLNFKYANFQIQNNLVEVKHIATGFMMIKRSLLEKLILHHPEFKFWDDMGCLNASEDRYAYTLFDCCIDQGHYLSEDWRFSKLVTEIGEQVWADVSINLTHTGVCNYAGRFLSSLNIQQSAPPQLQKIQLPQQSQPTQPTQSSPQPTPSTPSQPPQSPQPSQPPTPQPHPDIITKDVQTANGVVTVINSKNVANVAAPNLDWVKDLEERLNNSRIK